MTTGESPVLYVFASVLHLSSIFVVVVVVSGRREGDESSSSNQQDAEHDISWLDIEEMTPCPCCTVTNGFYLSRCWRGRVPGYELVPHLFHSKMGRDGKQKINGTILGYQSSAVYGYSILLIHLSKPNPFSALAVTAPKSRC